MIVVQFNGKEPVELTSTRLGDVIAGTLEILKNPDNDITLRLIDDAEMLHLNQTFRGEDKTTDVLSFNQDVLDPETGQFYLGDILISLPQATKQALEHEHSLEDEISFLAIHGTLHLLGYDHYTEEEKDVMWPLQDQIFTILKNNRSQSE